MSVPIQKGFGYKFGDNNFLSFNNVNIDSYCYFFPRKQFDLNNKTYKQKYSKNKINTDYDKLFFNLLVVMNHNFDYEYNRKYEKELKLKFVEKIQEDNFKYKNIDNVLNNISYDDNINIISLDLLCEYFKLNVLIYDDTCFYEKINNDSCVVYCIRDKSNFYEKDITYIQTIKENRFNISNLNKPIYSISHYKLDDLKEIFDKMLLTPLDKMRKKDYYASIMKHVINSSFLSY